MTTKVKIELLEENIHVQVSEQYVRDGEFVTTNDVAQLRRVGDTYETYIHQNKRLIVQEISLSAA